MLTAEGSAVDLSPPIPSHCSMSGPTLTGWERTKIMSAGFA